MMKLNSEQQQAITYEQGPLLIIAGAGTGKTTVITQKIEYLIKQKKLDPSEILALTFTEKAAGEMEERLDTVMPYGYEEPYISTFHGFADRLLRQEGLEIGLSLDYDILSTPQQWLLIKKNLYKLGLDYFAPLGNPNKFIHALLKFFSRLQDEDVTKKERQQFLEKLKGSGSQREEQQSKAVNSEQYKKYQELFSAFDLYQQLKLAENALDFGDLIAYLLKLLRIRSSILEKYRQQFKFILVDEFQDTNYAQLQLIKLLAPPEKSPNLTVVGDDDQSIYAFRGSSLHNILDFKDHYQGAAEVVLTTNYRSGQPILNAAYNSIKNNNPDRLEHKLKIDKKLVAARGKKFPKPQIIEVDSLEQEAEFVIEKILTLVGHDYTYKDFAILARANYYLDPFVAALKRSGIPYQLIGNRGLFDQREVRDLLFFLRVVADPDDTVSLFQFLHTKSLNFNSSDLLALLGKVKRKTSSLWHVLKEEASEKENYQKIIDLITTAQEQDTKFSTTEILFKFIQKADYLKPLLEGEELSKQLMLKNLNLFFKHLKNYDTQHPNTSVAECIEYFDLLMEGGENPAQAEIEDIDTVNLLTIHSAKGLEWPVVFLVNMVADRFPSRNRSEVIMLPQEFIKQTLPTGNFHLQEERRLFYVAVTRARDHLFAVYGLDYHGARKKRPSGFLKELFSEPKFNKVHFWQPESKQLSWILESKGVEAPKPQKILDGALELVRVSYSQIDDYKSCPLKYKYRHVLQVPTKPHHAFSFGTTIHMTLQQFHMHEMKGSKPTFEELLSMYEANFQALGYDSPAHRIKRFKQGKKALKKYYLHYQDQFAGKPFALEKSFRLNIANIPLIGRIDRIDILGTRDMADEANKTSIPFTKGDRREAAWGFSNQQSTINNQQFELVDYKTGQTKDQKTVDKDAQLTIYAMAAQSLFGKIPKSLSLYFIDDGVKVTTTRTQSQIDIKREEIAQTIAKIKEGNFKATPGFPMPCHYCAYNQICPYAKKS